MALDFSALKRIAYKGFETVEEQERKDKLTEQGYTIVDGRDNPFLQASDAASEPLSASTMVNTTGEQTQASARKKTPFLRASEGTDYNAMYRAAHEFHQRHNPPAVDRDYWRTHTVGEDDAPELELEYWRGVVADMQAAATAYSEDHFFVGLLISVFDELEREYKALRDKAAEDAI